MKNVLTRARARTTVLVLFASLVVALAAVGCGGSSGGSNAATHASGYGGGSSAATHASGARHASPPATAGGIPQGNGGDQDSDNNGGPSDGDGNI